MIKVQYSAQYSSQYSENTRSVRFRADTIAFRAIQLWQKLPTAIKDSSSVEIFKVKV